jgi:hypothetical protein
MGPGLSGGGLRYPGVYAALDFAGNHYELASRVYGNIANVPGWSFTRASTATYFGSDGLLQTASSGAVRFAYNPVTLASLGILVEEARINICLWNRDLTDAAWVKVNTTAAKDQTGIDGVANSASSITATGAAATILQTIVLASSTRQQSAWVKRITGSGVVNMTTDGVTWTAITLTAAWTRVTIPAQATVVNPVLGFQIMTSGDAIAADFVQNETGTGASSEIATTTAAVTREADVPVVAAALTYPLTIVVEFIRNWDAGVAQIVCQLDAGSDAQRTYVHASSGAAFRAVTSGSGLSTVAGTMAAGTAYKGAARVATNDVQTARGGTLGTADMSATNPTNPTRIVIGGANAAGSPLNGTISRIRIFNNTAKADAQLQALTA